MIGGGRAMKLLKIDNHCGYYRKENGSYQSIDEINKEDLLTLVNWTLDEDEVELEDYDESLVKNHAHQIIYKSIARKLISLKERKQEFIDESARLFLEDYERYQSQDNPIIE